MKTQAPAPNWGRIHSVLLHAFVLRPWPLGWQVTSVTRGTSRGDVVAKYVLINFNCSHTVPGGTPQMSQENSCPDTLFQNQCPTLRGSVRVYSLGWAPWHPQPMACGRCDDSQGKAMGLLTSCLLGCMVLEPATTMRKLRPCHSHKGSIQKPLPRTQVTASLRYQSNQAAMWFQPKSSIQLSPEKACISDQNQTVSTHFV